MSKGNTCTAEPNLEAALMMINTTKALAYTLSSCFIPFTLNFINVKMVCNLLYIFHLILVGIPS